MPDQDDQSLVVHDEAFPSDSEEDMMHWCPEEYITTFVEPDYSDPNYILTPLAHSQEIHQCKTIDMFLTNHVEDVDVRVSPSSRLADEAVKALPKSQHTTSLYQNTSYSPMSNFASPASYMSGSSPASFMTARSSYTSPAYSSTLGLSPAARIETIREDGVCDPDMPAPLRKLRDDYYDHLHQQNIVQPFDKELNWSGKGQHVTFLPKEPIPLGVLSHLGGSMTARVDKVLCRRIALARKLMRCSRQWTIAEALGEVYHLQNLRHPHIVQLVGSYLQGRDFSILMYPVADWNLGVYLEDTADICPDGLLDFDEKAHYHNRLLFLKQALACLTSAMAYVHEHTTKHMDIKPQNILVRRVPLNQYRVYLADFGLSRSFASQGHSQTDGPTSRTPRYCAPEVFQYERRGRSADIFSLGCVFAEIITVIWRRHPHDFADFRKGEGDDESFHANLGRVNQWLDDILQTYPQGSLREDNLSDIRRDACTTLKKMLSVEPGVRPTASMILSSKITLHSRPSLFAPRSCCTMPAEQYVAYDPTN